MTMLSRLAASYACACQQVDRFLQPLLALAFRLWLAKVFFMSGLTKIKSWDSTLALFEYEYAVPVIPFDLAAYLATSAELVLPVLLVLGLLGRFAAGGLLILNIVAVISYGDLSPAGVHEHYFWGAMLATLTVYGTGWLSVDTWLCRRLKRA